MPMQQVRFARLLPGWSADSAAMAVVLQVRSWGYEPLVVSCEGEGQGLGQVMTVLENKTAVVAGPSGGIT